MHTVVPSPLISETAIWYEVEQLESVALGAHYSHVPILVIQILIALSWDQKPNRRKNKWGEESKISQYKSE